MTQFFTNLAKILGSASRTAFLGLMFTACVMAYVGKLSQDNFMILATSAAGAYFATKSKDTK